MGRAWTVVTGLLLANPAAAIDFSGEWLVGTEWLDRGISQTAGNPALQLTVEAAHESGLYAAVWAGNVDFGDCCDERLQFNYTLGVANEAGKLGWDAGVTWTSFPGTEEDLDFAEYHLVLSWRNVEAGTAWTPDFANLGRSLWYHELNAEFELPLHALRLQLHAGYTRGNALHRRFAADTSLEPYGDWEIALARDFGQVTARLGWADTDMGGAFRVRDRAEFNDGRLFLHLAGQF